MENEIVDLTQWNLTELHEKKLEETKSDQTSMINYLMDCQTFLKERDLHGWIKTFASELLTPKVKEPQKKKRRMAPSSVIYQETPACVHCKSNKTIEDVREGILVCTICGIIQSRLLKCDPNHVTYDRLKNGNRIVVHRYSRVVYFRSFLLKIKGETEPCLKENEKSLLHQAVVGKDKKTITPRFILQCLKQCKLMRLRRHAISLSITLSKGEYKGTQITGEIFRQLLTLFRRIEFFWELGGKHILESRKVFFSYPYVFYQLCVHLKQKHLCREEYLLQSKSRLQLLHKAYGRLAKKANLQCDITCFRTFPSK